MSAELRVPPHSSDSEQSVLGGLMLDEHALAKIDWLAEEDFYRKDHRLIFRAIGELSNKNLPCDAVTMGEWFESNGLAELVGGTSYVIQLANSTPSAANIVAYAEIVRARRAGDHPGTLQPKPCKRCRVLPRQRGPGWSR